MKPFKSMSEKQAMSASAIYRITFVVWLNFRIEFPLCHAYKDLNDYRREKKTMQQCFGTCFHFAESDVINTKVRNQLFVTKEIIENRRRRSNIQNEKRAQIPFINLKH